jgi:hypothetical protein
MNFGKDINNTKLYKFGQIMIFLCKQTDSAAQTN